MQYPPGYGPSPAWNPPRRPAVNPAIVVFAVFLVVFVTVGVIALVMTSSGIGAFDLLIPFCFISLILIAILIASAAGVTRRPSLPPPPPIQQPMVPAGMEGPIAVNCPNCGAPPGTIDRFGVAICTHCGTRFLVR